LRVSINVGHSEEDFIKLCRRLEKFIMNDF